MVASFAKALLGWKTSDKNKEGWAMVPNCSDVDSAMSLRLGARMLDHLGVDNDTPSAVPRDPGRPLERKVAEQLASVLPHLDRHRKWRVDGGKLITNFAQYEHLCAVDELVKRNPELRVTIGRDYLIKPDVTVCIIDEGPLGRAPFLHAAISCKWTIRSDRVQNIRHEFNQMIRHRRGRQPHLVTVTAEPLPTRLAAIARGTGEVDAVYHIALEALATAVDEVGGSEQVDAWNEVIGQKRLLSYDSLAETLATW
jgi:hypothetical protein